jgi:hypothetical protein
VTSAVFNDSGTAILAALYSMDEHILLLDPTNL